MKIKDVIANNRKKAFEISTAKGRFEFPFSRLSLKPMPSNRIIEVYPDAEIGKTGFTYHLESGDEETILMDQVLEYSKDPDYLRKILLFKMTIHAQKTLKASGIKKREVIRRMGTTPAQFYRLMDQTNTHKTIDQMVRLLSALDSPVDVVFQKRAA